MRVILYILGLIVLALVGGYAAYNITLDIDEWFDKRKKKKEKKR